VSHHLAPLLKPPPSPREDPNPSRLGELLPCHARRPAEGEGEEKDKRGRLWEEPSAAKTGAARGRSRTLRRRGRLHPLLPLLPRRRAAALVFFPAGEPHHHSTPMPALRPVATEVRTTASLLLWVPQPSSRGRTHRCSTPPLVMPAFVPGWDDVSCRCRYLHQRARAACLA
jgi:hypothetical protein